MNPRGTCICGGPLPPGNPTTGIDCPECPFALVPNELALNGFEWDDENDEWRYEGGGHRGF